MTIKLGYCIHCGQANITCINTQKDGTMTHYSIAKQGECGPLIIDDVEIPEPNWKARTPPPAEPVGLGTFARTAAIIATPEPAEPGLREEDLRRLAIYSVATCDINGGNKRDRPAILLEQAIAALALVEGEKK